MKVQKGTLFSDQYTWEEQDVCDMKVSELAVKLAGEVANLRDKPD
jgi:hypothetical protein